MELRRVADPAKAPDMQAYMKSELPFHGVQAPVLKRVVREALAEFRLRTAEEWRGAVLTLWREATHREERYAALGIAGDRRYREYRTRAALPLYEELVVTGAWWDYVDWIAKLVAELFDDDPAEMAAAMRAWSRHADLWKRRVSIISQLPRKRATDLELLYDCIEANLADRNFFIRKAIGWALREYSKVDAAEVRRYVETQDGLSPLSRREALKWVNHVHVAR